MCDITHLILGTTEQRPNDRKSWSTSHQDWPSFLLPTYSILFNSILQVEQNHEKCDRTILRSLSVTCTVFWMIVFSGCDRAPSQSLSRGRPFQQRGRSYHAHILTKMPRTNPSALLPRRTGSVVTGSVSSYTALSPT